MDQVSITNEVAPSTVAQGQADSPLSARQMTRTAQKALLKSLSDAGLDKKGIESLDRKQLGELVELLQRGEKTQALVIKVFNAVAEGSTDKVVRLVSTLSTYHGSFSVLSEFLFRVGCDDPFKATERAQILYLPAEQLPTSRGASGHVLKGTTYCAYDRGAPADSIGYFSKKQAIAKIFEAFNQDRFNSETRTETRERRTRVLREELYNVTLDELEATPELSKEFHSPLLVRNLAVYQELRKAINDYQEQMGSLLHAGVVTLPIKGSLKVSQDAGRQLLGWFEEHLKENLNVPQGIKIAYENLRDPDIFLSAREERDWLRGLLAYQRLHTYIDKTVALGGMAGDLVEYERLPVNDPLRLNSAVNRARQEIQSLSDNDRGEITIAEYSKVIELSGLVEFRRAINDRILSAYGESFHQALAYFDFVTFKDGKRLPDSYQESVPMERLKEHVLGAKIGVAQSHFGDDKKQAVLGQRDFRAISDAHNLFRIAHDRDKALIAWPIKEFREMVRGVIVAYRKAQTFDAQLEKFLKSEKGSGISIEREAVGDELNSWKPTVMTGSKWQPIESPIDEQGFGAVLDLREVVARASDRVFGGIEYGNHRVEIEAQVEAGLIAEKFIDLVSGLQVKAQEFMPAVVYRDALDRAVKIISNPMVEIGYDAGRYNLNKRYLHANDFDYIKKVLEIEPVLQQLTLGQEALLGQSLDTLRDLRGLTVMKGEFAKEDGRRGIILSRVSQDKMLEPSTVGIAKIYNPERIKLVKEHLDKSYIAVAELGNDWLNQVKFLCSNRARDLLMKEGLSLVDSDTFRSAQHLRLSQHTLVNRAFAERIASLYGKRGTNV